VVTFNLTCVDIDPTTWTVSEGQAVPYTMFAVIATDADIGDSLTYSISGASAVSYTWHCPVLWGYIVHLVL